MNTVLSLQEAIDQFSTKKAITWSEVSGLDSGFELDCAAAAKLRVMDLAKVYGAGAMTAQPCQGFEAATPTVFILLRGAQRYLVDTQGYNYARYILRLA